MAVAKDNVVFAFLGSTFDMGFSEKRWERWRPTPALVGHEDELPLTRVELMYTSQEHLSLLERVVKDLKEKSPVVEVRTHFLELPDPWDFPAVYGALFDLFRSYDFDTAKTNYFLQLATGTHVAKICLFLLAEARIAPAQLLTTRPFPGGLIPAGKEIWRGLLHVVDLSRERYAAISSRFAAVTQSRSDVLRNGIPTRNRAFNEMIEEVEQVASRSSAPMLLTGPTGAGKSQLASRIYELRREAQLVTGEFVEVNCATLRGDNALSTLFGHKKGAFTGAVADRKGVLQLADGGIVFLDEIGEMPLEEQTLLLKALEEKRFTPLGSDKPVHSDFQLIAGTNRDLGAEVAAGRFREDLFARINVWTFRLPGLAERREDIEPNLEFELRRNSEYLKRIVSFNSDARKRYLDYAMLSPWPGNFRDLSASVQRMATLAEGGRIDLSVVEREIRRLTMAANAASPATPSKCNLPTTPAESLQWVSRILSAEERSKLSLIQLVQADLAIQYIQSANTVADVGRRLLTPMNDDARLSNPSDRARKYLATLGLDFFRVKDALAQRTPAVTAN